jgi:predicted Mrr-cat superfamily restriction endonuclease
MPNYWLLSSGKDGELWPTFWNDRVVAVGWSALGDLSRFRQRDDLGQAFQTNYPKASVGQRRNNVTQLWSFCQRVQKGEIVFVRSYGAIIGIGEVQTEYEYLPPSDSLRKKLYSPYFEDEFPHVRRVRWLSLWGGLKQSLTFTRLTLLG